MMALLAAIPALVIVMANGQEAANLIPNGGFEADADGDGMADGWRFSGDESVTVTWSLDEGVEGQFSQRLDCTAFERTSPASHVMLALNDGFALREGQWYRLTFQARGRDVLGSAAQVAIQQTGPWENLGCDHSFRLRPEWQPVETTFRATKTVERSLRLQIWFMSTGTMWLDDVRLTPTQPVQRRYTEVLPDLGSKNLIPNASFDCGTSGWGSITQMSGWGGNVNTLMGEIGHTPARPGNPSLKIAVDRATAPVLYFDYFEPIAQPVLMPLLANRGWISVKPGEEYTLSADVKSEPPATPVRLRVYEAFAGTQDRDLEATGDWQRVYFTFRPSRDQVFVALGPNLTEIDLRRATLWVDDVQLEHGPTATIAELRAPVEVGTEWEQPGHLFPSREGACFSVIAHNQSAGSRTVHLTAAVTDYRDAPAGALSFSLDIPALSARRKVVRLNPPGRGFFRVSLSCEGGALIPTRPERFAVIQECRDRDGLFAMNHAYPPQELNRLSQQSGLTWFRDWSLKWQHVEPEKGRFEFADADRQIGRVLELGLNVLPLLPFPSSDWASSAPESVKSGGNYPANRERAAHMPRDMDEFANYVRTCVLRYKNRLHAWEIMNEPIYTNYALPRDAGYEPADYVRLLAVAYRAVKQADPQALVIGGIAASPDGYTRELIEAGGLEHLDALNLHMYPGWQAPEGYVEPLRKLRAMMAEAGALKPLWFTEGAYYADDDTPWEPFESWLTRLDSELLCSAYLVRLDAILLAFGAEKIVYHSGTPGSINNEGVDGVFWEWSGAPRKMAAAQAQLTALLGPDTKTLGLLSEDPYAAVFHSRGRTVVLLWSDRSEPPTFAARGGGQLLDLMGNPLAGPVALGEVPHYLLLPGLQSAEAVRAALAAGLG